MKTNTFIKRLEEWVIFIGCVASFAFMFVYMLGPCISPNRYATILMKDVAIQTAKENGYSNAQLESILDSKDHQQDINMIGKAISGVLENGDQRLFLANLINNTMYVSPDSYAVRLTENVKLKEKPGMISAIRNGFYVIGYPMVAPFMNLSSASVFSIMFGFFYMKASILYYPIYIMTILFGFALWYVIFVMTYDLFRRNKNKDKEEK